jgi:hypothetical protein
LKKFKEFLKEAKEIDKNDFMVGDIVMIRYWLTGDVTPVKIVEKITKNNFIVSHKVQDSELFNAPNQEIKKSQIIGVVKGVGDPVDATARYVENPNIRPDTSGIIPGANSWPSNDIAF